MKRFNDTRGANSGLPHQGAAEFASIRTLENSTSTGQSRRHRPWIPNETNLQRARAHVARIKAQITAGTFCFADEFPRYRGLEKPCNKKTHNNAVSALRRAFDFGYLDYPERRDPAASLKCARIGKNDRPPIDPFSIQDAEVLIAAIHRDWGEAQGNYDSITTACSSRTRVDRSPI